MIRKLDMQFIRYMNLFGKVTKVNAQHCFSYNNMLIFAVPKLDVAKAIGRDNENLQRLSQITHKRIRIVAQPKEKNLENIKAFITTITVPIEFNSIEVKNNEVTISAGREGKARLIGRQRIRQKELSEILQQYFGIIRLNIV